MILISSVDRYREVVMLVVIRELIGSVERDNGGDDVGKKGWSETGDNQLRSEWVQ